MVEAKLSDWFQSWTETMNIHEYRRRVLIKIATANRRRTRARMFECEIWMHSKHEAAIKCYYRTVSRAATFALVSWQRIHWILLLAIKLFFPLSPSLIALLKLFYCTKTLNVDVFNSILHSDFKALLKNSFCIYIFHDFMTVFCSTLVIIKELCAPAQVWQWIEKCSALKRKLRFWCRKPVRWITGVNGWN